MAVNGLSGMNPTQSGTGFLSFNSLPPRLIVTAEDNEFDEKSIEHWQEEGYDVTYLPMGEGGKPYVQQLKSVGDELGLGEVYAIVAYGDAATVCLEVATKPMAHCCALICYYPSSIPHPNAKYPTALNLVVHLTASQALSPKFKHFTYSNVEPGFAEHDLDEFNSVAAGLAWTRSLTAIRRGFKREADIESVRENHVALSIGNRDAGRTIANMSPDAQVNYGPTMTGGVGKRALYHFYSEFFGPAIPESFGMRLVSRTSGVDRVIDEFVISFRHNIEMPWILPGVPPTNRQVELTMVSIIAVRGNKLVSEHVYWDQASVLVQIGALDPSNVPEALKSKGCTRLPVIGAKAARKILNPQGYPNNDLIQDW